MYWKFNLITSNIDSILDKGDDVTIEEILDEEDVLQECKAQNKRLLDFFMKDEITEQLVNLTLDEPSEDKEEKLRFKYPNLACELLTCDVQIITDKLANSDHLLTKIYSFLQSDAPLNPLQASFFSKVLGLLISRKSDQMLEFLRSKDDFITHLLQHIGTSAIMDLLLRLIIGIDTSEARVQCVQWLNEQKIIQKLVGLIDPSETDEKHCNAAQSLCDIIRLSREQMSHLQEKAEADPLLDTMESPEVVSDLLHHMFHNDTKVESVLVSGLQVIQTLLEFRKPVAQTLFGPEGVQELTALDTERLAHGVSNTVQAVTPYLGNLHQLLLEPPKQFYCSMPTTIATLEPPLGSTRLNVIKLISSLIMTNNNALNQQLASLGTVKVIMDMCFKYTWNNFLHSQVEHMLSAILNSLPVEQESGTEANPLLLQLFTDYNLFEKFMDLWDENDQAQSRPGGRRRGYMGHLTKYCNLVMEKLQADSETSATPNSTVIRQLFTECSGPIRQRWESFVSESLTEMNKKNTVELVGSNTFHSSSDSEDPDFSSLQFPQDTAMQQAFSDYQLQQMTSTFVEQFGFNEDEFTEQHEPVDAPFTNKISSLDFEISTTDQAHAQSLFEQACNERLHQFDDSDSDEDLWDDKEITFTKTADIQKPAPGAGQTLTQGRRRHGSDLDDDEEDEEVEELEKSESSDSEEELNSPRHIYQTPTPTSAPATIPLSPSAHPEKMDVDSTAEWPILDEVSATDAIPVAMDTVPWEGNPKAEEAQPQENWAHFEKMETANPGTTGESAFNADFTNLDKMESDSMDDRPVSPCAMDTNDSNDTASVADRMTQYMIQKGDREVSSSNDRVPHKSAPAEACSVSEDVKSSCPSPPSTPRQAWSTPVPPSGEADSIDVDAGSKSSASGSAIEPDSLVSAAVRGEEMRVEEEISLPENTVQDHTLGGGDREALGTNLDDHSTSPAVTQSSSDTPLKDKGTLTESADSEGHSSTLAKLASVSSDNTKEPDKTDLHDFVVGAHNGPS